MNHEVHLSLMIADFEDITHDEISQLLGIQPHKVYIKGEKRSTNATSLVTRNRWLMKTELDEFNTFENHMNALIDLVESKINLFKPLFSKYHFEFLCALYIRYENGESIPSINLGTRYHNFVKNGNFSFDLDIYTFPNGGAMSLS